MLPQTGIPDQTIKAVIALLDAMKNIPAGEHASLQMHDRDGVIVRALAIWAAHNRITIRHHVLTNPDDRITWDCFEVVGSWGTVDVHDHRSEREMVVQDSTAGCWSVAQHTTEGAL